MPALLRRLKAYPLWAKILIGFGLGIIFGSIFGEKVSYIAAIGDIFLGLLYFLAVPLIFFSLIAAVCNMQNDAGLFKSVFKMIGLVVVTTLVALLIGLTVLSITHVGVGQNINIEGFDSSSLDRSAKLDLVAFIVNIVPRNPFTALSSGNFLQIIFFAVILGIGIRMSKKESIKQAFIDFSEVMYNVTALVIELAPYGVFALMANMLGTNDFSVVLSVLGFVVYFLVALGIHYLFLLFIVVGLILRLNPFKFAKKIAMVQLTAFSTSTSSGTLPVSMNVAQNKLGISKKNSTLVLPICSTINMNGTAMYILFAALFVANMLGVELDMWQYIGSVILVIFAAIGTAGVPGASLAMIIILFNQLGLPLEGLAIILGVHSLLDMFRTTINVTGDLAVSLFLDKTEGALNEAIYNG